MSRQPRRSSGATRIETDTFGPIEVPAERLWGAQTERSRRNFQIGDDVRQIPLRKPATAAGELEVSAGGCTGEKVATLPLAPAAGKFAVTQLPSVQLPTRAGKQDLCFMFTQASVDPMWAIDSVELLPASAGATASE